MDLIETRREFHKIPETGFNEIKTTKLIIEKLRKMGIEPIFGGEIYKRDNKKDMTLENGYTGALVEFGHAPFTLFRADIDGLPVTESESENHTPKKLGFISQNVGNMHACGHDGHITMGLALAECFKNDESLYKNRGVRILFQPAEEGVQGAESMSDKITEDVDKVIGFHIGLGEPGGYIGVGSTNFYGVKKLELSFYGKAAHACNNPEGGTSALDMALSFINLTRSFTFDSKDKRIMNIGMIHGGNALNIVMDKITLGIDLRSVNNEKLDDMYDKILKSSKAISESIGGTSELKIIGEAKGYVETDLELVKKVEENLNKIGIKTTTTPDFGASEDVTKYIIDVKENGGKAIHLLLGADLPGSHHSSTFDFDDNALADYLKAILETYKTILVE